MVWNLIAINKLHLTEVRDLLQISMYFENVKQSFIWMFPIFFFQKTRKILFKLFLLLAVKESANHVLILLKFYMTLLQVK